MPETGGVTEVRRHLRTDKTPGENKLKAQVSGLGQELTSEKSRTAEPQKAVEQSKENIDGLQSEVDGKDCEVSAPQ